LKTSKELFYAKILLFGEYSVLLNSMGLSIPYTHFSGQFSFLDENKYTNRDFAKRSNHELKEYLTYLKASTIDFIDINQLEEDIQNQLYFESRIPEGYGLGSSGALCAAIYHKYAMQNKQHDLLSLKDQLSKLESGFHGKSSGLDPLNSYLKTPLLIQSENKISKVHLPGRKFSKNSGIFLIDTKQKGNTAPLVKEFLIKCQDKKFTDCISNEYIPVNNSCIKSLLQGNEADFFKHLNHLSSFQYSYFKNLIPEQFHSLWKEGITNKQFFLKLCGSGGGGFLLAFTSDYQKVKTIFSQQEKEIIPVYVNEK